MFPVSLSNEASIYSCDVANHDAVKSLINDTIDNYKKIDILINNAGITRDGLIMRMNETDWNEVIDINLKGAFNTIKAVSREMMKKRSGRIINISSIVGLKGNSGQANYSAAKAGIIGATKAFMNGNPDPAKFVAAYKADPTNGTVAPRYLAGAIA